MRLTNSSTTIKTNKSFGHVIIVQYKKSVVATDIFAGKTK